MGIWKFAAGVVRVRITSAAATDMLTAANRQQIVLYDVRHTDDLTVEATIYRKDLAPLQALAEKRGEKLKVLRRRGLYWTVEDFLHRPVLLGLLAVLLAVALFLPTRVLFIRVEGNLAVPTRRIVAQAEACGLTFGASRREVRSERMKNALLEAIPELQWAGINTSGCVATISVKERSPATQEEKTQGVCSIVATRDGIIRQCTVLRGNSLCRVGQAVTEGQVLVSGYTDCGISIRATRAEAEIFAQTRRDLQVLAPVPTAQRGDSAREETRYLLLIGKNLIKLFKGSGISDTTCVKMYEENYLTLPGGFVLPVALVRERLVWYDPSDAETADAEGYDWTFRYAEDYLTDQMIAGEIQDAVTSVEMQGDCFCLLGEYTCYEMIGRVQSEEIIKGNGKSN